MALYFVGDIQGCYSELIALLAQVNFNEKKDQLWVAGDLVARGPDSLATLRYLKSLGDSAKVVLGNHDLHLLAIHANIKKAKKQDLLGELFSAPDLNELMDWLILQPLLQKLPNEETYMSHAGIAPQWTISQAIEQAEIAHQKLISPQSKHWLQLMYGETPNSWQNAMNEIDKFRYTINAFTRMRFCWQNGALEFTCKSSPLEAGVPKDLKPWYELSNALTSCSWIFGHWATLMGQCSHPNAYALDTGCVWGNHLTLLRWHDKQIYIEQSHKKSN